MKILALVARILLGLMFLVFGLNNILGFLHMPPMAGDAGDYMRIFSTYPFFKFIGVLEIIAGLLLLVGRFVPLALVVLGPILVNILMFHLFLAPSGIALGAFATLLEVILIVVYRKSFYTLFHPAPEIF